MPPKNLSQGFVVGSAAEGISAQRLGSPMNKAIARQSSPIVVLMEQARHAGGRGFESRRSRLTSPCKRRGFASVGLERHVEDVPHKCPNRSGVKDAGARNCGVAS